MDVTATTTLFTRMEREVWLVTSQAEGKRGGLIATSVGQASIVPELPRITLGLAKQHHTWEVVEASGVFTLHLLSADNIDLVWRFGLESGRNHDKFAGLDVKTTATGCPLLEGTLGWLDCRIEARLDIGDRTFYVAEVVEGQVTNGAPALTSSRLMEQSSPSQRARMLQDRQDDSDRDARAIRAWRTRHNS